MPQANLAQTSWRFGEVSPLLRGRADLDAWKQGCEKLENFVVTPQGSVLRRPGTEHITNIISTAAKLVEFRAADNSSYVLIIQNYYDDGGAVVLKDGVLLRGPVGQRIEQVTNSGGSALLRITAHGVPNNNVPCYIQGCTGGVADGLNTISSVVDENHLLVSTYTSTYSGGGVLYYDAYDGTATGIVKRITGVTLAAGELTFTTSAAHGFLVADIVGVTGILGATEANGQWTITATPTTTTFKAAYSGTLTTYTSGGVCSNNYLLVRMDPLQELSNTELTNIDYKQSADVMFFAHPSVHPHSLARLSDLQWEWRPMDLVDGPYLERNQTYVRLTLSDLSDTATFFDLVGNVNFDATDDDAGGDYLQYREDNQWKLARVTAYVDAEHVTADIKNNLLLNIDQTIALKSNVNRATNNSTYINGHGVEVNRNQNVFLYQKRINALKSTNGVDPAANLDGTTVAGTLSSGYAGTFTRNDIGKFIKDQSGAWRQITGFTNDKTVSYSTPARIAGASDTNEADLIYYDRAITATITASGPTNASSQIFASTDVGRLIRLNMSGISIWCRITAYTSATEVDVEFFQEVPLDPKDNVSIRNGGVITDWQLGAWSVGTGYPSTVAIHEQRLVFGGSTTQPQTVWMSASGDYWNFSPTEPDGTVQDDNAITYTIASEDVNPIVWMVSAKVLLIGTAGGEWQAKAASSFMEPLTPSNLSVTPQSAYGSYPGHRAQRIGSSVYFLQKDGTRLRKMSYSFDADGWVSSDVSLASEHIMRGGREGTQLAYQQSPFSILWVLLNDGTLASVTINEDENQFSWAHHTLGQHNSACVTYSILVVNKDSDTYSRLYISGQRNESADVEIERLGLFWLPTTTAARTALTTSYLDNYAERTLSSATTASTAALVPDGASVGVWINGVYIGTKTVSSGAISLGGTYSGTAFIGYPYTSTIKQLPPEGGSAYGVSLVKTKRTSNVGLRVFSSYKLNHGPDESNLTEFIFTNTTTNFFTGDDKLALKRNYDYENGYVLSIAEPWPLNILALAAEIKTNE